MGVSTADALKSLLSPLYLFVGACMMMSAATELVTTQRIESLLAATGVNALLVLAFINGIMIIGRAFAGPIQTITSTVGMLWFSAIFSFIGMQLLAGASGSFVFVGAAFFALGITFFGRRHSRLCRRICLRVARSVFPSWVDWERSRSQ